MESTHMENELTTIYRNRFDDSLESKDKIWQVLCRNYFQKFVDKSDTVLDLAAGYGEFLNHIQAKKKIAVDLNPDIKKFAQSDVEVIISDCKKISQISNASIDKIFISNFLEHLKNTDEVLTVFRECHRILKVGGQVMILQPNIYYVKEKYWFFIDHHTPLTHESLVEGLEVTGYKIAFMKKKFLPYTTKSKFPQTPFFVKTYLMFSILHQIFGKQTFVIGTKK